MEKKDFRFKKEFGQNFIFDKNFLNSIVKDINLDKESNVLEIGAGMGTLSECLAQNFKKVVSFEIDKTLKERLGELSQKYDNLTFVFEDIMKVKISEIDKTFGGQPYFLIANLPYYITSPIIFRFLLESKTLKQMYVMVQKEVGERFCADKDSKEYGASTVILNTFGKCEIFKNVNKKMFTPMPKVDSCIIKIDIQRDKFDIKDLDKYKDFVNNCFKMKRKTLYNNLCAFCKDKEKILSIYKNLSLPQNCRSENLSPQDFFNIYNLLEM